MYEGWFGAGPKQKAAGLTQFQPRATARIVWPGQRRQSGTQCFYSAVAGNTVYAGRAAGQIARVCRRLRRQSGVFAAGMRCRAASATARGWCWQALRGRSAGLWNRRASCMEKRSSPVRCCRRRQVQTAWSWSVPAMAGFTVWNAADRQAALGYQRPLPSLALRSFAGVVVNRGRGLCRISRRSLGGDRAGDRHRWLGIRGCPAQGATELERVTDVTSYPVIEARRCAPWRTRVGSRVSTGARSDAVGKGCVGAFPGMGLDARNATSPDDRSAILAFDRAPTAPACGNRTSCRTPGPSAPLALGPSCESSATSEGYAPTSCSREDGAFVARIATDGSAYRCRRSRWICLTIPGSDTHGGVFRNQHSITTAAASLPVAAARPPAPEMLSS